LVIEKNGRFSGDAKSDDKKTTMELLTPKQIRKALGVSLSLVYRWAKDGTLPCVRFPCRSEDGAKTQKDLVRFRPQDVESFINKHRQK
jgi:predicted DNA-binding transcriptional regulator AlpA